MKFINGFVLCFFCCSVSLASEGSYKAGIIGASTADGDLLKYISLVHQAAKSNADIVVLPSPKIFSSPSSIEGFVGVENYDEVVEALSKASKQAGLYVVAHLVEKTICQSKYELVRSNLVFDRSGEVLAIYRKPLNNVANCTTTPSEIPTFTTDFGVRFGLLMEEDLVLQKAEDMGVNSFVVAGSWSSSVPFLSVSQFTSSWAFTNKVDIVSSSGVFAARPRNGLEATVTVIDLKKAGEESQPSVVPVASSSDLKVFPGEDLSQYTIRPLNLAASAQGYKETVCHNGFCCEFYVKTSLMGPKVEEVNYGLAAFNGVRHFGKHNIGTHTCGIFACAGLYKRTCTFGSTSNNTNVVFERLSIHTNSSSSTSQYPIILTAGYQFEPIQFNFNTKVIENQKQITIEGTKLENILSFGIFGRDFTKDSENVFVFEEELSFKDEMQEMFDYLWIRIRILIFVVSIYFLEMM